MTRFCGKFSVLALILVLFSGCVDVDSSERFDYRDHIATSIATHGMVPDVPVGPVDEKHAREDCPTGGWITHGDGHRSRCPFCDPPYTGEEAQQQESAELTQDDAVGSPLATEGSGDSFDPWDVEVFPEMPDEFKEEEPKAKAVPPISTNKPYSTGRRRVFGRKR